MVKRLVPAFIVLLLLVAGCQTAPAQPAPAQPPTAQPAPEQPAPTAIVEEAEAPMPVLDVIGPDGATITLTMSELEALSGYEGWGGLMSSTGRIFPPALYAGVPVAALADLVGGLTADQGVRIIAEDGYAMTISYDQIVNGDFVAYDPGTGQERATEDKLQVVIAFSRDGEPLPADEEGRLRMALLNNDPLQVTDGHWWVKWVRAIEVRSLAEDWDLQLDGAISETMDRNTFESCASPSCHGNTYTDDAAQVWSGVPLWLLAGRVDDENPHEGLAFDRALAEAGYLIELTAADGYTTTIDSQAIAQIDEIIVAYLVNENPLDEDSFPMRLMGPGLSKKQMIGQIRQIALQEAATPAEEPAATPEPTPEPVAEPAAPLPACEGALAIAGLVETAQCWTLADLQAQPTVELTIEHPKKGPQPYSGWRLNDLLDLAGPAAEAVTLVFTASDGYSGEAALADVRACPDCLVALGDDGLLSLAMPGFESFVWVKDVVQVEVK